LDTEAIFVDGTHIKASANMKKQARKAVPKEAKRYAHELFDEIEKRTERSPSTKTTTGMILAVEITPVNRKW